MANQNLRPLISQKKLAVETAPIRLVLAIGKKMGGVWIFDRRQMLEAIYSPQVFCRATR